MNWGHKIAILYTSFALLILFMVYMCVKQTDIFLVSPEYYKEEMAYQDRIDEKANAQRANMDIKQNAGMLQLHWDKGAASGSVLFFRPSDANKDLQLPLELDSAGKQNIPTAHLDKGLWRVKLRWTQGNKNFYQEQAITL